MITASTRAKLPDDQKKPMLGELGERYIERWLRKQGEDAYRSLDLYDRRGDIEIGAVTVEVKTQVPFRSENAFSIKPNQLPKCQSVDRLFFVNVDTGDIYEANPKTFRIRRTVTNSGRRMVLIPMQQDALQIVGTVPPETLADMKMLSTQERPV